jgi:uncharacterized protein (DUF58 family)
MSSISQIQKSISFGNLALLAKQIVEGYIVGLHKSPFHGFSAEFAAHKRYNQGESTKHIDWKLFAKTDKLYTKKFEEETNLRCHLIVDNSASMHYPDGNSIDLKQLNKISFAVIASAVLMQILKKQRDAVGLSIYSDSYEYYAPEKTSERHHKLLLHQLEQVIQHKSSAKTDTYGILHEIAKNIKRRSLVILFTDMFQPEVNQEKLFDALQHLKFNKHDVILFHVYDKEKEKSFNFENTASQFVDVETGAKINLFSEQIQDAYQKKMNSFHKELRTNTLKYKINYIPVAIQDDFEQIITSFLLNRN